MNNQQILNLADVETDDFKAIQDAVDEWKLCGMPGTFGFISEQEKQECIEALQRALKTTYNKGAIAGGVAALVGIGVGAGIWKIHLYFKAKKERNKETKVE